MAERGYAHTDTLLPVILAIVLTASLTARMLTFILRRKRGARHVYRQLRRQTGRAADDSY
jgi:hypothetical protein